MLGRMDWNLHLRLRHEADVSGPKTASVYYVVALYHAFAGLYSNHALVLHYYSGEVTLLHNMCPLEENLTLH